MPDEEMTGFRKETGHFSRSDERNKESRIQQREELSEDRPGEMAFALLPSRDVIPSFSCSINILC